MAVYAYQNIGRKNVSKASPITAIIRKEILANSTDTAYNHPEILKVIRKTLIDFKFYDK
jgi:hypothetical protein